MTKLRPSHVIKTKFSQSEIQTIVDMVCLVNFSQPFSEVAKELSQVEAGPYCWLLAKNPAYYLQYQVDAFAFFKIQTKNLIVWQPKFLEYPSVAPLLPLSEKKLNHLKIEVDPSSTVTQATANAISDLVALFYGTHFHSDQNFETSLVTQCKHVVSRKTAVSYWHCVIDDANKVAVGGRDSSTCLLKLRISGARQDYDKSLFLFSAKGVRGGILPNLKGKWKEALSFLAMLTMFLAIISCDSSATEGMCVYRKELMLGGAGLMLALFGLKLGARKSKKSAATASKAE